MTLSDASNNIAISILKEEQALNNLLEIEAKKIKKFIDEKATAQQLSDVNESVNQVTYLSQQIDEVIKKKLSLVTPFINN